MRIMIEAKPGFQNPEDLRIVLVDKGNYAFEINPGQKEIAALIARNDD